nr:MAG TPA: hypothetical protein [Caudoviricetes sp.]
MPELYLVLLNNVKVLLVLQNLLVMLNDLLYSLHILQSLYSGHMHNANVMC